jgi:hypothetical protein
MEMLFTFFLSKPSFHSTTGILPSSSYMIFLVEQLLFSKYRFAAEGNKVYVIYLSILMLLDVYAGYRRT